MRNGLIEYDNGQKVWFKDDKYHREDGPACEWGSGYKSWWQNGKFHREDGPAIEYSDGSKLWYINGKQLTEAEFNEWRIKNRKNKIKALEL